MIDKSQFEFRENIDAINFAYTHDYGTFLSFDGNKIHYVRRCREDFSHFFKEDTNYVGFFSNNANLEKVDKFFSIIHKKLKLKKAEQIIVHPTKINGFVVITVPYFWRCSMFRRGMFTLFLRCASCHYKGGDDIIQGFTDYSLTNSIMPLINRFLNGFTETNAEINHAENVVYRFSEMSEDKMSTLVFAPMKKSTFAIKLSEFKAVKLFQ